MENSKNNLRPVEYFASGDNEKKNKKKGWFHCFVKFYSENSGESVWAEIEDEKGNMVRTYSGLIKFLDR